MRIFAEQPHHQPQLDAVAGQPALPGTVGLVLVLAGAVVAGAGLVRPLCDAPGPVARRVVWAAAAGSMLAMVGFGRGAALMIAHVVAVLLATVLLPRRIGGFLGGAPLTVLLVAEASSIVDLEPVYVTTGILVLGAAVAVAVRAGTVRRLGPVALVGVLVAGGFGAALSPGPAPVAGVPRLARAHQVPVLVAPGRPGPNLVLVAGDEPVRVGNRPHGLFEATPRPGLAGRWATLDLPAGASTLWVERAGQRASIDIDTGHGPPSPGTVTGPDGPECASAALGTALAEPVRELASCPADALHPADRAGLRGLVSFLAGRGVGTLTMSADSSNRSAQALAAVRDAAAGRLSITDKSTPDGALLVLSGWSAATASLAGRGPGVSHAAGTYLAPWLLSAPVIGAAPGAVLPLSFDPRDERAVTYANAVGARLHGQTPTASGYREWLAAKGIQSGAGTRLYAASPISVLPRQFAHHAHETGWLPGGTVVPITGPLGGD